ncbi:MAG: energy transducer TonB [Pseudomonadota bacterium]
MARYLLGVALGAAVTFGLFLLMQALIDSDESPLQEGVEGKIVDFVRLEEETEVETKDRKPEPPPPPPEEPPETPDAEADPSDVSIGVDMGSVNSDVEMNVGDTGGFSSDGEYLPIVKVAPVYPRRAQTRGIEGHVLLEFTVTKNGSVKDPVVVEAEPPGIFDRAAKQAALKFKYKPKVVNGEPIEVAGVQNLITFELSD